MSFQLIEYCKRIKQDAIQQLNSEFTQHKHRVESVFDRFVAKLTCQVSSDQPPLPHSPPSTSNDDISDIPLNLVLPSRTRAPNQTINKQQADFSQSSSTLLNVLPTSAFSIYSKPNENYSSLDFLNIKREIGNCTKAIPNIVRHLQISGFDLQSFCGCNECTKNEETGQTEANVVFPIANVINNMNAKVNNVSSEVIKHTKALEIVEHSPMSAGSLVCSQTNCQTQMPNTHVNANVININEIDLQRSFYVQDIKQPNTLECNETDTPIECKDNRQVGILSKKQKDAHSEVANSFLSSTDLLKNNVVSAKACKAVSPKTKGQYVSSHKASSTDCNPKPESSSIVGNTKLKELSLMGTRTNSTESNLKSISNKPLNLIKCFHYKCDKLFPNEHSLAKHMKNVHNLLPIICPYDSCVRSFADTNCWKAHARAKHSKDGRCDKCRRTFSQYGLYKHVENCHQEGHFGCVKNGCAFVGKYRDDIERHYRDKPHHMRNTSRHSHNKQHENETQRQINSSMSYNLDGAMQMPLPYDPYESFAPWTTVDQHSSSMPLSSNSFQSYYY